MPPAEDTVFTPDSEPLMVELVPPGEEVDVEDPPGMDVEEVEELELVEGPGLVVEDEEVLAVDVVALMTGAPGASLTWLEAAATTAQVAAVTTTVAASHPSA